MLRKVLTGNFPQLSAESCECERSHTVRQKAPCPTFRNFPSSCCMLLQQRIQRSSTLRTVSAGLSAKFSAGLHKISAGLSAQSFRWTSAGLSAGSLHRYVQKIAAKVLENRVPLTRSQGRRALRGPSTLQKLVRQTVGEQMPTNRLTENFQTGFRGPLPGGPFSADMRAA